MYIGDHKAEPAVKNYARGHVCPARWSPSGICCPRRTSQRKGRKSLSGVEARNVSLRAAAGGHHHSGREETEPAKQRYQAGSHWRRGDSCRSYSTQESLIRRHWTGLQGAGGQDLCLPAYVRSTWKAVAASQGLTTPSTREVLSF